MKSALMPSLRDPQLSQAAEGVMRGGRSLSRFMEQSLRDVVTRRQLQREFVVRGFALCDEARRTREYFEAKKVHAELCGLLINASGGNANR